MIKIIHVIFIMLIIILIIYWLKVWYYDKKKEKFNGRYGTRCFKCENKTLGECMECSDCGYCLNLDGSSCMAGDFRGPYDHNIKCNRWIQNDPWSSHQFVNS
jgi:hypothetical protein